MTTHPIIQMVLDRMDEMRVRILARTKDCEFIQGLMDRNQHLQPFANINDTTCTISINVVPDRLSDLAPFLRALRSYTGVAFTPEIDQGRKCIHYHSHTVDGSWYVCCHLGKKCTFKLIGTKTKEEPIYQISCEGDPADLVEA